MRIEKNYFDGVIETKRDTIGILTAVRETEFDTPFEPNPFENDIWLMLKNNIQAAALR